MLAAIHLAVVILFAGFATPAFACPICLPPQAGGALSLERMASSGALVLAHPQADPRRLTVNVVVKGRAVAGETIGIGYADMPRAPFEPGKAVVLARHPLVNTWQPVGALPRGREDWFRTIVSLPPASGLAAAEWPARLQVFADDLFADDAFVSQIAADQIARAPYRAMRTLRSRLDGERLVEAANRMENIPRLPLLILLMGIAGDEPARAFVSRRIASAGNLANRDELAALITARIEMEGEPALKETGARLLASEAVTATEVNAALMALDVVGGAFGEPRRTSIVAVYRDLLGHRPETAGLIARSVEDWGDWSLAQDIVKASDSSRVDEGSRLLIRSYLEAASSARSASIQK